MNEVFFTVPMAARLLNIGKSTLYRYVKTGLIRSQKTDAGIRLTLQDMAPIAPDFLGAPVETFSKNRPKRDKQYVSNRHKRPK